MRRRSRPPRPADMPVALLLLIAAGLGWAWWTGRLKGLAFEDGIAGAAFLLGMRFATTGKPALGLPLVAGATLWAFYRRKRARPLRSEERRGGNGGVSTCRSRGVA